MRTYFTSFLIFILPICANANNTLAQVDRILNQHGVEAANNHLDKNWEKDMMPFSNEVVLCNGKAIRLATKLHRTTNAAISQAHAESLRQAMESCPEKVLRNLRKDEINFVCLVEESASEELYEKRTKKRVALIKFTKNLANSPKGRACIDYFENDLARLKLGPWQNNYDSRHR